MAKFVSRRKLGTCNTSYELIEEGVRLRQRTLTSINENFIEYDRIGHNPSIYSSHSLWFIIFGLFFAGLSILTATASDSADSAWVFLSFPSVAFFVAYFATRRSGMILASDFGRLVIDGKIAKNDDFISALSNKKEDYIRDTYELRVKASGVEDAERYLLSVLDGGVIPRFTYRKIQDSFDNEGIVGFGR